MAGFYQRLLEVI